MCKNEGGMCHPYHPLCMEMGGRTNSGGTEHSTGVVCNLSMGGGGTHMQGVPHPPPPFACKSGTQIGGPHGNGNQHPLPPCTQQQCEWGMCKPRSGAPPPPFFCAPCPSQRGCSNQGVCKPGGAPPPLSLCTGGHANEICAGIGRGCATHPLFMHKGAWEPRTMHEPRSAPPSLVHTQGRHVNGGGTGTGRGALPYYRST